MQNKKNAWAKDMPVYEVDFGETTKDTIVIVENSDTIDWAE